jgi:hypothetical protein
MSEEDLSGEEKQRLAELRATEKVRGTEGQITPEEEVSLVRWLIKERHRDIAKERHLDRQKKKFRQYSENLRRLI